MNPFANWTPAQVAEHNARLSANRRVRLESEGDQDLEYLAKRKAERGGVSREIPLHNRIMEHCDKQWPKWKYIRARSDQPSTIAKASQWPRALYRVQGQRRQVL
jgi:hypothetical protein